MKMANLLFSIIMIGLSVYMFIYSMSLGKESALFPTMISVPLFVFSVTLLIFILKGKDTSSNKESTDPIKVFKFFYMIITMTLYSICINFIGFYISTVLLFTATALILAVEPWNNSIKDYAVLIVTAIIVVGVVYSLFKLLLGVPLPEVI